MVVGNKTTFVCRDFKKKRHYYQVEARVNDRVNISRVN